MRSMGGVERSETVLEQVPERGRGGEIMVCPGVGRVKMTVGVKRSDQKKVQYCITAIDTGKIKQEAK